MDNMNKNVNSIQVLEYIFHTATLHFVEHYFEINLPPPLSSCRSMLVIGTSYINNYVFTNSVFLNNSH